MNFVMAVTLLIALCFGGGCKGERSGGGSASADLSANSSQMSRSARVEAPAEIPRRAEGRPQPRLGTLKLWIGTNELTAEIAQTMPQIMSGMMWRTNMAEMDGMLFIFRQPHRAQFWMRNTLLPLSCAYIDPEGTILELHDMKARDETPIPADSDQVQYVLEVNQGWFERHKVTPGMLVTTARGSLPAAFRR